MTTRRNLLAAAAAAPLLAACDGARHGAARAAGTPGDLVMIIRHGEKPAAHGAPYGVTADGERSDGSLTVRGWTRAGALAALFADPARAVLHRPDRIFAASPEGGKALRHSQTVTPLAERLGQHLDLSYGKGHEKKLGKHLAGLKGVSLVAWEHHAIPDIAAGLGASTPGWPDDRFDLIWLFTRTASGWTFSQAPQFLLSGDRQV
ncbi:hypothetical protein [Actinomadura rupiterrae]|uniref:hypothetical protein n=1 Tax=Actinomadura rupiterrae TaxID=559627 RepID=UPI0020A38711|nr:hypothetical protein [Actinomadura rupiterrae]MCP2343068.1 broad specificity phosphatase PhoE [Actinomadura rupiterrae]